MASRSHDAAAGDGRDPPGPASRAWSDTAPHAVTSNASQSAAATAQQVEPDRTNLPDENNENNENNEDNGVPPTLNVVACYRSPPAVRGNLPGGARPAPGAPPQVPRAPSESRCWRSGRAGRLPEIA